jgi:hypothetical protein
MSLNYQIGNEIEKILRLKTENLNMQNFCCFGKISMDSFQVEIFYLNAFYSVHVFRNDFEFSN